MNYSELLHGIQSSIKGELNDYEYYIRLAEKAPNEEARNMILSFAKDERGHAKMLNDAFYRLTARLAPESAAYIFEMQDYRSELAKRVIDETKDSRKYRDFYVNSRLDWLKEIFFDLLNDEAEHATRLLLLISEYDKCLCVQNPSVMGVQTDVDQLIEDEIVID